MGLLAFLTQSSDSSSGSAAGGAVAIIIYLAVAVLMIAALWVVFTKAGQKGWLAIIPILNYYVLLRIVGRPGWWIILYFIPCVNIVIAIIVMVDLAKSFGKSPAYAIGLILLPFIFLPMLAWGDAQFQGDRRPVF